MAFLKTTPKAVLWSPHTCIYKNKRTFVLSIPGLVSLVG